MSIDVREAREEDVDDLLPLVRYFVSSFTLDDIAFKNSFVRLIGTPGSIALVAEQEEKLIGYCLGFCHDTFYANGRVAWLEEIMVPEPYRRKRVGEALRYDASATYYRKLL